MISYYYLIIITMTTLTLRIDEELKNELKGMAKNLGLSLNQLMNLNIRDFVKKKELNISLENENFIEFEDFNDEEIKLIKEDKELNTLNSKFNSLIEKKWI